MFLSWINFWALLLLSQLQIPQKESFTNITETIFHSWSTICSGATNTTKTLDVHYVRLRNANKAAQSGFETQRRRH